MESLCQHDQRSSSPVTPRGRSPHRGLSLGTGQERHFCLPRASSAQPGSFWLQQQLTTRGVRRCSVQTHGGLHPSPACCCSSLQLGPAALRSPATLHGLRIWFLPVSWEGGFFISACVPLCLSGWIIAVLSTQQKIYAVIDVGNSCGSEVSEQ